MHQSLIKSLAAAELSHAFDHSVTWEDDIWRADPADVEAVHAKAREKFRDLLDAVTDGRGPGTQARILLFHGQSGAGKTHLLRALRTAAHRDGKAYFAYAQMTPDIGNYAEYYLRRLVYSLEKPYNPDQEGGSALAKLTEGLVEGLPPEPLKRLRNAKLDDAALARLVLELADAVVAADRFRGLELDINTVRALLYLERRDARIDQRVRQYLTGRALAPLAQEAVAALDPLAGEDRAFDILTALGQLMRTVSNAALVFAIDQVEDLRSYDDFEDRFQRAIRDLIQIANRLPNAIVIISCLDDFYGEVRGALTQPYIDRIEKAGPVALSESRSSEEARLIVAKRLAHEGGETADPATLFGPHFAEELAGLSARRLLEEVQSRLRRRDDPVPGAPVAADDGKGFIAQLARALGFAGNDDSGGGPSRAVIDYREAWNRFESASEVPLGEADLLPIVAAALPLAADEWGGEVTVAVTPAEAVDDLPVLDIAVSHRSGFTAESRVFICNRATQGGGLKRQLDKVLAAMGGKCCFMLRSSEFPSNRKNQTAQAFRKFRESGGRPVLVPLADWERMMTVRAFYAHHKDDPGFKPWFQAARLLSHLTAMVQLLRLDLLVRSARPSLRPGSDAAIGQSRNDGAVVEAGAGEDEQLPMSVLLDENASDLSSIVAGRALAEGRAKPITLNTSVLKRHSAVLGGSGSGKTTLALCLIEQLLLRGVPAVLIDRKGDLCSYANPDVWRAADGDEPERQAEREKLAKAIDVAVYTPGRALGRPISITLLPNGIAELPDHEQQLLANLSAAALGDMLHLKNSATHQKQSGTLSVALRLLGSTSKAEVSLGDLIDLLEDEDPMLTELTQRMDPTGRIRRDLVAQLDSLRHRNSALFEGGGEPLRMDALLGLGPYARPDRTRLSIIYTGFLGDNENILFWIAQFLSEALRFCQRNPNDALQALVMFDEADLYIPASSKPATAEPLQSLLKRARSAGLGIMLATQSPGDLDYKSRDQITSWFIGRVREDTALRKLKAAFQSESGLEPAAVLPQQTVGEFHLVQEGMVRALKAQRSLVSAEQVPFDRIEQLARETKGLDERQLRLFDRLW